jgi:hypothetical protein
MKRILFYVVLFMAFCASAQSNISSDDLTVLIGDWTGTLTYMDYSTNEPFSMPANVTVKMGKNENQLVLFNEYPNEPKANGKGKVTISRDEKSINGNPLISRESLEGGDTQFTTESTGKDNNEKALIRNIYVIGDKRFVIRKEVKFESSEEWLIRNEFNYTRD